MLLAVVIALLAVSTAVVVLVALERATSANTELTDRLVPAQLDTTQLDRLYRDLAVGLATGEMSAANLSQTWQSAGELRDEIRRRSADDDVSARRFAAVEQAADAWVDVATPDGDPDEVRTSLGGYALLRDELASFSEVLEERVERQQDVAQDATQVASSATIVAAVLLLAGGIGVALAVRRWITRPLDRLAEQASSVAAGRLTAPIAPSGPSDLAAVGVAVEAMRRRLLEDATHRVDSAIIAGHQAESARIAGDLHDDQVQAMTLVSIRLQQLRRHVRDDAEAARLLAEAERATSEAIDRLRRMIFELHSPVLERDGLTTAIEVYLDETFRDDVAWSVDGDPGPLDPAVAGLAYRLAREAMFNAFKHAAPSRVDVEIERAPETLAIVVRDDGRGFDAEAEAIEPGHLGSEHARRLAAAAGGTWTVASRPGGGTTVRFSLPVTGREDPPAGGPGALGADPRRASSPQRSARGA